MTMHNETQKSGFHPDNELIGFLWPRVRSTFEALVRVGTEGLAREALLLQFRVLALLAASEPAATWQDVEPKVLVISMAASLRPDPRLIAMLDAAVALDHDALNRSQADTAAPN